MSSAFNKTEIDGTSEKKTTDGVPPTDVILPNLKVHECLNKLKQALSTDQAKKEALEKLMTEIKRDEMLPLYESVCNEFNISEDKELIQQLEEANRLELDRIEAAILDAEENLGDVEVKDCYLEKANFYCRIGDMSKATEAYEIAQEKTVGSGGRLNIALTLVRISILFLPLKVAKEYLDSAKRDCAQGGDWEKRNKLKIYEALYFTQRGNFVQATELFYSCVAIFTASEILDFESFIILTVILSLATFDRPALKQKIISCPEICQVIEEQQLYKKLLHSFYNCEYQNFMTCLLPLYENMRSDFYLAKHASRLIKMIRLKAYQQYLNPYSSIFVHKMAVVFGISSELLESDLAEFIASGKLSCKIDCYRGIVHCSRTPQMETSYGEAIKQGDILLEKIQKLSNIIDV